MFRPSQLVSVVVPTFNERSNVAPLCDAVFEHLDRERCELLFVDDDSPDKTADAIAALGSRLPVRCVVRRGERGLATAVVRGIRESRGELVVVMDADLSHPASRIPALVEAMSDDDVEMAVGSRFVAGGSTDESWSLFRRVNSWIARALARPLTGLDDPMSGFFCVRRRDLRLDALQPIGYKIALELIVRHGWRRIIEIPIAFDDRRLGRSKLGIAEQIRYLRHLWRLYWAVLSGRAPAPSSAASPPSASSSG